MKYPKSVLLYSCISYQLLLYGTKPDSQHDADRRNAFLLCGDGLTDKLETEEIYRLSTERVLSADVYAVGLADGRLCGRAGKII